MKITLRKIWDDFKTTLRLLLGTNELELILFNQYHIFGVDTFVQGTVVQGDLCPRGQMFRGTGGKGDFGPRRLLSKEDFTRDKLVQMISFYFLFNIAL